MKYREIVFIGSIFLLGGCAGTLDMYGGMEFDATDSRGNPYGAYGIIYNPDTMPNTELYIGHQSSIPDTSDNNTAITNYGFRIRVPLSKR